MLEEAQNGRHVESVVLEALEELEAPADIAELLKQVHQRVPELDDFAVRKAVWRLLDRRRVDMTLDRRLKAVPATA